MPEITNGGIDMDTQQQSQVVYNLQTQDILGVEFMDAFGKGIDMSTQQQLQATRHSRY